MVRYLSNVESLTVTGVSMDHIYYYAYWKENGKTKKKYIGKYDPREDTKKLHEEIHFQ
ncbi:MAG: hypothetical protein QN715_02310 [Nitrososphaeraceae archaeon]|nr:hypothetical protein [Nitrososphaeraceae archaeon]MDW0279059.1 hypothetical protein [Nitrososphaeraceae archaeon]MDW0327820.1 hypothetical protein [Nitrososphaeraceae archaeon]